MRKKILLLLSIVVIALTIMIVAAHILMRPKNLHAIQQEFDTLQYSAPVYKSLQLHNGKKINYLIAPNNDKPIFFIVHGSPGAASDFLDFFKNQFLRDNYEIIAIDRLGFGFSDNRPEPSIQKQTESIAELIKSLVLDKRKMIAFSHSYGVPIMLNLSCQHPLWFEFNIYAGGAHSAKNEKKFFFNPIIDFPPIKFILPTPATNSNDEKLAHPQELKKIEKVYNEYQLPSLFIHGKKDNLVDFKNQEFVKNHTQSPSVLFLDLEEKGHLFPLLNPDYTLDLLTPFLK